MARDDEINATALTLHFKYAKYTILLLAEPLTPFSTIKADLLTILKERYPDGLENSKSPSRTKIPDSILDIVLGVQTDSYDPSKGWDELNTGSGIINESPKSLGLKDGAKIAFAFVGEEEVDKEEVDKEEVDKEEVDKEAKELFHVEYPNLDELYPEEMAE